MKKLYVFLAVIFAFALSLTGCNNQGGSSVNYGEYGVSYEDTQSSTEPESSSEQVLEQDNSCLLYTSVLLAPAAFFAVQKPSLSENGPSQSVQIHLHTGSQI